MQLRLLEYLFDALPLGLVVLDAEGRIVVYNRAEERMAARSKQSVMGRGFFEEVAPCMDVRQLAGQFRDNIGKRPIDLTVEMTFPFPHMDRPRDVRVRMASFEADGAPHGFLVIEDTSLQRSVERMKEQLQSLLVHDLKNPLSSTWMNLQLLEETPSVRDAPDALELVENALDSVKRVSKMTLTLLDIGRLETASMELRRTRTSVDAMFARVINDNRVLARVDGKRLGATPSGLEVSLDEDLLVRALDNLVENALRHAKTVTLSARADGDRVTLDVTDDGPGVPEALRERLFDRYVQISTESQARGQNRGLGLTFVRLVAQAHGGDAEVICPASGGSVFRLDLVAPRSPSD